MTKYNMDDKPKTIFADGLFWSKPHEKAPEWIRGKVSVQAEKFIKFLRDNDKFQSEKGWVNINLCKSKDGAKYYFTLDTWKPKVVEPSGNVAKIDDSEIPF